MRMISKAVFINTLCLTVGALALGHMSYAQSAPIEDEVIARGTIRGGDPAMGAFFSGDFATAEIEFQKNFRRIKRDEMQLRENVRSANTGSITSEIIQGPGAVGSGSGSAEVRTTSAAPNLSGLTQRAQRTGEGVTSGKDLGFQRYMMAMSQLKLGKFDAAEDNFKTALALNNRLFDADLRLGLLALNDSDSKTARKHLRALDRAAKRCRDACENADEIKAAQTELSALLEQFEG
ncbi:tetratricopeptide repeat protein [Fretibacter rubidus]|uniref:tetratricopeptide repeat protein n=1 Tax=Fretibacter rubidus TaxID=570162 RepID=UPI00352B4A1A